MSWPVNPLEVRPLTGEPCAGNLHARFGGGRDRTQSVLPTPIFLAEVIFRTAGDSPGKSRSWIGRSRLLVGGDGLIDIVFDPRHAFFELGDAFPRERITLGRRLPKTSKATKATISSSVVPTF